MVYKAAILHFLFFIIDFILLLKILVYGAHCLKMLSYNKWFDKSLMLVPDLWERPIWY